MQKHQKCIDVHASFRIYISIFQLSPDDDQDRESIQEAIKILRNVASAINEFKRRKDLGENYTSFR